MKRAVIIVIILLVGVQFGAAQDAPVISPELESQMENLEAVTRAIRSLDGEPVERGFPTREETIAYLRESIDQQLPLGEAVRYQHFYVALDLLEPDIDLREVYLTLLGSQVAGFYDTDTNVMNVIPMSGEVGDSLSVTEQIIYIHEFNHALQDQFFDLNSLLEDDAITAHPDRAMAVVSLVEGDATAVMNVYTQQLVSRNPMAAFQMLGEGLQAGNLFLPPGTPAILTRELMYPYEGGTTFVAALYDDGGWEMVNAAFANPPVATEQVMHPEKYIAGEQPLDVSLADSETALGEGWTRIWDTTLGEWYLREHLRTQLPADAGSAAAGWGGDQFHIYHSANADKLAWVLRLAWDTPEDSSEFNATYLQFGDARFEAGSDVGCWSNADEALCLTTIDDNTLIASAPTVDLAQALIHAQG